MEYRHHPGASWNPWIFQASFGRLIVNCIEDSAIFDAVPMKTDGPNRQDSGAIGRFSSFVEALFAMGVHSINLHADQSTVQFDSPKEGSDQA